MIKLENILIAFYGITTVCVFILMIFYGGLFDSLHSVFFREISFLISPWSLKNDITIPLYRLYNIQLFMFSLVLLVRMKNIFMKLGALYLSMSAVTSLILIKFPMDPLGTSKSMTGTAHITLLLVIVVYMVIALTLFGYGFKSSRNLTFLSQYTSKISVFILSAGFLTGVFAYLSMPQYVGFTEKLPITAFLIWIIITSLNILRSDKRIKYEIKAK